MSEVESFINDPQILRELIMDHYQYPHNHKLVKDDRYLSVHMASDRMNAYSAGERSSKFTGFFNS